MENHIFISGKIGNEEGAVSLKKVKDQYNPMSSKVITHISSDGGDVKVGLAIRDFLTGLPQEVHTIGEGMVASIATMPFLAGSIRELKYNCQFLGHLPRITNFSGNSDDFERANEYMQRVKARIAGIYSDYTNKSVVDMEAYMRKDIPIFAQSAKDMGFATHVEEFRAVAELNTININKMNKEIEPEKKTKLELIGDKFMNLLNSIGEETVEDVVEQKATEEVINAEVDAAVKPEVDEEKTALISKVEELEAEIAANKLVKEALTNEKETLSTEVGSLKEAENVMRNELTEIQNMTLGLGNIPVANIKPQDKSNNVKQSEGHYLDAFAKNLNKI